LGDAVKVAVLIFRFLFRCSIDGFIYGILTSTSLRRRLQYVRDKPILETTIDRYHFLKVKFCLIIVIAFLFNLLIIIDLPVDTASNLTQGILIQDHDLLNINGCTSASWFYHHWTDCRGSHTGSILRETSASTNGIYSRPRI